MNRAGRGPRTGRPAGAPAYYLGRPATLWLSAARRRPDPVVDGAGTRQRSPAA